MLICVRVYTTYLLADSVKLAYSVGYWVMRCLTLVIASKSFGSRLLAYKLHFNKRYGKYRCIPVYKNVLFVR